jgi:flagellar basal body rod protein FlgC
VSDFDILGAAASGMQAQRAAMDVDARNVALAQTGDVRHPAYGLVPHFSTALAAQSGGEPEVDAIEARINDAPGGDDPGNAALDGGVVAFTGVSRTAQPIDAIGEMIDVLDAQRAYEADASVFDIGKRLVERTIDMGRL